MAYIRSNPGRQLFAWVKVRRTARIRRFIICGSRIRRLADYVFANVRRGRIDEAFEWLPKMVEVRNWFALNISTEQ